MAKCGWMRCWLLGLLLLGWSGCNFGAPEVSPSGVIEPTNTAGPFIILPTPTSLPTEVVPPLPQSAPLPTLAPDETGLLNMLREGGSLGQTWSLADLRYGVHEDHVRIVWELAEPGATVPQYRAIEVGNAETPSPEGYDPAWGAARIDVTIHDLYAYSYPLGEQLPIELLENPVVTRVGTYPTYDDATLGFSIGLTGPLAYRVYELTDPVRLVVDVLYP